MKRLLMGFGLLSLVGFPTAALADYSSDCVAFLSRHFGAVSEGAFGACTRVNNPFALVCIKESARLKTITDGTFLALTRCDNPNAVQAVHELFTKFTTISDGAVWYVAGTQNPGAAACIDNLAAHFSQIDDAAFAACAN